MKKLLVLFLVMGLAAPVMAAEWNFYGQARMNIGSYSRSKEFAGSGTFPASDGINDDTDTRWALQTNSRVGANVKASDAISGRFEFGTSDSNVSTRLIYGTWDFGSGKLRVGQDYTPIDIQYSNQIGGVDLGGDDDLYNCGMAYEGRKPQIKLQIAAFEAALISPNTSTTPTVDAQAAAAAGGVGDFYTVNLATGAHTFTGDVDTTLPKIELAYTFATDMFSIKPYFGYNAIEIEQKGLNPRSEDIDSMVYGLAFKVNLGPAYVNGNVYGATNPNNYGLAAVSRRLMLDTGTALGSFAINSAGKAEDSDQLGGAILVGFKVNDTIALEAGYGMIQDEITVDGVKVETDIHSYYIQCAITLAPGVAITPEYGVLDYGDVDISTGGATTSLKAGDASYIAAKMQINF